MTRPLIAVLAALLALSPLAARAQTEQQTLVDRATLAVQEMLGANANGNDARNLIRRARGAMICPRVFKAGFFFGGEGGGCVMVGRLQTGWTAPAFYGMGSGSFGLQIGIQDSEVMFIVLTEKGLHALLDSQFKIGADAGVAIATIGAGVQGSTTAAFHADIVAFFAGPRPVRRHRPRRRPDRRPQRLERGLLRPPDRRPADRAAGRGQQSGRRAAARGAGSLLRRVAASRGAGVACPAMRPPRPVLEDQAPRRDDARGMGEPVRRLRPLLPAQAALRGHRRAQLHQRRLPAARPRSPAAAATTPTAAAGCRTAST